MTAGGGHERGRVAQGLAELSIGAELDSILWIGIGLLVAGAPRRRLRARNHGGRARPTPNLVGVGMGTGSRSGLSQKLG